MASHAVRLYRVLKRTALETPASWLADFEAELFAFPRGRHDDQVDSISQALAHKSSSYWTKASIDALYVRP
jgi:phage terminase large subunit-like protein